MPNLTVNKTPSFFILFLVFTFISDYINAQEFLSINNKYNDMAHKAREFQKRKLYKDAAKEYLKAFSFSKEDVRVIDYYNVACCFAQLKEKNKAYKYLNKAIENHYSNYSHLIKDKDFLNLYKFKKWDHVVEKARRNEEKKQKLSSKLDTVLKSDQQYRLMLDSIRQHFGSTSMEMKTLLSSITRVDSVNFVKVSELIDSIGWPGYNQAGHDGALAVFLVIQHSSLSTQLKYLPLLIKSARKGEAAWQNFALLQDRILISQGEKQTYGTQVKFVMETKKHEFLPIEDEKDLNKRRASVGLQPIEEYAKLFNISYGKQ